MVAIKIGGIKNCYGIIDFGAFLKPKGFERRGEGKKRYILRSALKRRSIKRF